jgi:predicted outer membrane repeat protein
MGAFTLPSADVDMRAFQPAQALRRSIDVEPGVQRQPGPVADRRVVERTHALDDHTSGVLQIGVGLDDNQVSDHEASRTAQVRRQDMVWRISLKKIARGDIVQENAMSIFRLLWVVLAATALPSLAFAATFCVSDSSADLLRTHATVHDAVRDSENNGAGEDTIKVRTGSHATEPMQVSGRLRIIGGFTNCAASTPTNSSQINGSGFDGSIFRVVPFVTAPRLYLERIGLTGGRDNTDGLGGAIEARGAATVVEFGPGASVFANTAGSHGGAIHLTSGTLLLGNGAQVVGNTAGVDGGGIYCDGGSVIQGVEGNTSQTSSWSNNLANRNGGALTAVNGCTVVLNGGLSVVVANNSAMRSGGAFMVLNSYLTTRLGTFVSNNTAAEHGGGIYCGGTTNLLPSIVNLIDSQVQGNNAALDGGGMRGAQACLLGVSGATLVASNHAKRGGGASVTDTATLRVNRTDPNGPLMLQVPAALGPRFLFNRACGGGAGIHGEMGTQVRLRGAVVSGNDSIGTAGCVSDGGAGILMTQTSTGSELLVSSHESCPDNEPCNQIEDNRLDNTAVPIGSLSGVSARGGGINVLPGSVFLIEHVSLSGNRALAHVLPQSGEERADGAALYSNASGNGSLTLRHAVIAENHADGETGSILYLGSGATITYVTTARNTINARNVNGGALIRRFSGDINAVQIRSSILDDTDFTLLDVGTGNPMLVSADCSLVRRIGDLPNQTRLTSLPAAFVDAANGNFRPAPNGPQIDYCDGPAGTGLELDLDLTPRGLPNPSVVLGFGNFDAGAYESKLIDDVLMSNGFE